jgi:hypothetical protein
LFENIIPASLDMKRSGFFAEQKNNTFHNQVDKAPVICEVIPLSEVCIPKLELGNEVNIKH